MIDQNSFSLGSAAITKAKIDEFDSKAAHLQGSGFQVQETLFRSATRTETATAATDENREPSEVPVACGSADGKRRAESQGGAPKLLRSV